MSGYVPYEVSVDVDAIVAGVVAEVTLELGITPNEGDPVVALAEVFAQRVAETRIVQADVAAEVFRAFGTKIGVTTIAAAPASMTVQFTVTDTDGYTIPSGTRVLYRVTGSESVAFATTAELVIPPASTTGTVTAEALIAGTEANGLTAAALAQVDPLAFVTAVASTTTTSGGVDAETSLDYLDRLADELTLLSLVPRLPGEFAKVARRVAGVHRARDFPGYDADTSTPDVPGHVTVAVVEEDGTTVSAPVKADVEAALEEVRALNVIVHVVDPTFQAVTVDFTAVAEDDADPLVVETAAIAAVEDYLDPATWAGGGDTPPEWRDVDVIRYLEVASVLNAVPGLDHITTLTIDGGTANVTLTGLAVLPTPTVTGSVT